MKKSAWTLSIMFACLPSRPLPPGAKPVGEILTRVSYQSGICGVYNLETVQVEWKSVYQSGVAGVYNPKTAQVEWKSVYRSGVALVSTFQEAPTLSCSSFYGGD